MAYKSDSAELIGRHDFEVRGGGLLLRGSGQGGRISLPENRHGRFDFRCGVQMTPSELRAEADRLEDQDNAKEAGKVFIETVHGIPWIHKGTAHDQKHFDLCRTIFRPATESEVEALCTIPEFAEHLKKVRGEA